MFRRLIDIYTPNNTAAAGPKTTEVFAQLLPPTSAVVEPDTLRQAISSWDRTCAYPYPDGIDALSFQEEAIHEIPISIYRSTITGSHASAATVILLHGSGFFCELGNVHRSLMANIINQFPCHAILPHYSLAPESKAPQAINETVQILESILTCPEKYGVTNHVFLIGYSAGGNLALNSILKLLHSEKAALLRKIKQLILMSPWVDVSMQHTKSSPYQEQQDKDLMLQTAGLEQLRDWYLPTGATGLEAELSPLYRSAEEMRGIPPTTVIVGEIDRLLGDGVAITELLDRADIPTQLVILDGQSHNHSCHNGLRDGVFTADIMANIMQGKPIVSMLGDDNLGLTVLTRKDFHF